MILCFQCEDLAKIFLVSKFETNSPNIKLIITFCAICIWIDMALSGLKGLNNTSRLETLRIIIINISCLCTTGY